MAIGDLTGDGENEIAAILNAAIYKWIDGEYRIIGWNLWIFQNGGGNGDCYIGDCDNDGKNDVFYNTEGLWFEYVIRANITRNNLYSNGISLNLIFSDLNKIRQNNFDNNYQNVMSIWCSLNNYYNNYWERPRVFPKIIFEFPRINIDWYPAKEPFDNT